MRRRDFIGLVGTAAIVRPRSGRAEVLAKRPLVAVLAAASEAAGSVYVRSFQQGLTELGYVEGRDIEYAIRFAEGDASRLPALAEELARLDPRVIVSSTILSTFAFKKLTETTPIVGPALTDPIGFGLAASNAHPGGQVTGILVALDSLPGKQLEVALEAVPGVTKVRARS